MAVTYVNPPIERASQSITYQVMIDAGTVSGASAVEHVNFIPGDTTPGMISDSANGYLLSYFDNLIATYYPGNMAGALTAILANTNVSITVTGTGASICSFTWVLDTEGGHTALALQAQLTSAAGPPLVCNVEVAIYVPTSDEITVVTTDGSSLIARQTIGDLAFVPVTFAIGEGGYDPYTPQLAIAPDPTATALENEMYRSPIENFQAPTNSSLSTACRIPPNAGLHIAMGELGIFVQLTVVNNSAPLAGRSATLHVGDQFLFAISHFPMRCLTPAQTDLHRTVVDF